MPVGLIKANSGYRLHEPDTDQDSDYDSLRKIRRCALRPKTAVKSLDLASKYTVYRSITRWYP